MKKPVLQEPASILITGASSGIGEALAEHYSGPGIALFLSGRNGERLESVAAACRDKGATVLAQTIDVSNTEDMQRWIRECNGQRPLDLVIANAGISGGMKRADDTGSLSIEEEIFAVNVHGVFNTVLPALECMKTRGHGQIALMSSLAGLRGLPSAPAYSTSKVAVRAYGEALRPLMAAEGIAINVIMPGFVVSRITDQNAFPMPMIMTAKKAARIIRLGLAANKARIAFPWAMYAIAWVLAVLPSFIADWFLTRLPKKD